MAKHDTMPPFDKDAICPKCGEGNITAVYIPTSVCWRLGCAHPDHHYPEHISRTCYRCHYQWREAPLDTRREEDADGTR